MSDDAARNIAQGLDYVRRQYGNVSAERLAEIHREQATRAALAAAVRPRLNAAIDAYWKLAYGDDLVADIAHLHAPRHHRPTSTKAHCEGCDVDGMDPEEPTWPCTTARTIAESHGINLDGMETYEWR